MFKKVLAVDIGNQFMIGNKPIVERFPDLGTLISIILPNVYILAGIILFLLLIGGGYGIIAGAGSGDSDQVGKGQKTVMTAVIGFIIIFASYWIIQIIEVVTGLDILKSGV